MKKILSFILTLSIILTSFISIDKVYANNAFTDVNSSDWFYSNVIEMVGLNIVNGYPDGTFKPQGQLKADEFIKMLIIGMGYQPKATDSTYWADGYIQKAEELKIVDKTFIADYRYNLTREQAAKIIVNTIFLKEARQSNTYDEYIRKAIADYYLIADKYKQDMIDCYNLGIMQGNDYSMMNPKSTITRAEATTVVLRMMNKDRRLSVVEKLNLDKYTINLTDAEDREYTIVAPILNGEPVVEIIEFAKLWLENLDKTKGLETLRYNPNINGIGITGFENQRKLDYIRLLNNSTNLSNEEITKAAMYLDYTFNVSLIDIKGKYVPYKSYIHKKVSWLDDETYKNQNDKWNEYFTEYYLDGIKPIFKYLFEKDYDKALNILLNALNSNSDTIIRKSEVLNDRYFDIVYDKVGITFSISLKNQYK